jgi:hypothetical protein
MAQTFETYRELEVEKSADEVWEFLSNIGNAMTANQFHMSVDADPAELRAPKVGLEVPIMHEIFGARHVRIARVTKYHDYEVAWGERLPNPDAIDRFPHSEGWRVEARGPNRCIIHNHLRGRQLFALSDLIGKDLWDIMIPPILDNDLQDVALAVGAIEHKTPAPMPPLGTVLHNLSRAQIIDGKPAKEFLSVSQATQKSMK